MFSQKTKRSKKLGDFVPLMDREVLPGAVGALTIMVGLLLMGLRNPFNQPYLLYLGGACYAFGSATFPATVPTLLAKSPGGSMFRRLSTFVGVFRRGKTGDYYHSHSSQVCKQRSAWEGIGQGLTDQQHRESRDPPVPCSSLWPVTFPVLCSRVLCITYGDINASFNTEREVG